MIHQLILWVSISNESSDSLEDQFLYSGLLNSEAKKIKIIQNAISSEGPKPSKRIAKRTSKPVKEDYANLNTESTSKSE